MQIFFFSASYKWIADIIQDLPVVHIERRHKLLKRHSLKLKKAGWSHSAWFKQITKSIFLSVLHEINDFTAIAPV